MSKYFYLNDDEYKVLLKNLSNKKVHENNELVNNLKYQFNKLNSRNDSYILAAKNLFAKQLPKMFDNEDILVDEDANISTTEDGAYVQCWVWIDNSSGKKTKRAAK